MAASYPSSTKSFTTHTSGQTVASADINAIQDETVALENGLRTGLAHDLLPDGDVTRTLGNDAHRWLHPSGTVTAPGVAVGETDCGVYHEGTNAVAVATNGVKAFGIDSTQFIDSPTQPRCVVYNSATQSINDSAATAITFDSEDLDVGALHSTSVNTSRMTVPTGGDGFYEVLAAVTFASNATGYRRVDLFKNGALVASSIQPSATALAASIIQCAYKGNAAATDYFEAFATQTSGGSLATGSATRAIGNWASLVKLW